MAGFDQKIYLEGGVKPFPDVELTLLFGVPIANLPVTVRDILTGGMGVLAMLVVIKTWL